MDKRLKAIVDFVLHVTKKHKAVISWRLKLESFVPSVQQDYAQDISLEVARESTLGRKSLLVTYGVFLYYFSIELFPLH